MVSSARRIWLAAPPIVRAALHAAWAASKVDAISLASLFTIVNLAFGTYEVAEEHLRILELPGIVVDGTVIFVLSLLFSFVITVPVSSVIATCAYPLLRTLGAADQRASGIVGFLVGTRLARHVVEWTSRESILRILDFLVRGRRSRRLLVVLRLPVIFPEGTNTTSGFTSIKHRKDPANIWKSRNLQSSRNLPRSRPPLDPGSLPLTRGLLLLPGAAIVAD